MSSGFEVVRAGYDQIGPRYRDWSRSSQVRLRWVARLLDESGPDSVVVDLGCGPGEPATRLLAEHHRVLGVDGSLVQLRLAQTAAPAAGLVQADITRLAMRPGSVDAVASFYMLGHVPARLQPALLAAVASWLRPGGLLLTSAPLMTGDHHEPDWLGVPMFFGGMGEDAIRRAVIAAGLHVETWEVEEDEGDGVIVSFLWLMARRPVDVQAP
ncbi:MAG: class I SAM-dependent methyltransferase [Pseudonocardia sp.]|nr:class I SAM-dependent methyltransferase [Pseudonocardia sp.]